MYVFHIFNLYQPLKSRIAADLVQHARRGRRRQLVSKCGFSCQRRSKDECRKNKHTLSKKIVYSSTKPAVSQIARLLAPLQAYIFSRKDAGAQRKTHRYYSLSLRLCASMRLYAPLCDLLLMCLTGGKIELISSPYSVGGLA